MPEFFRTLVDQPPPAPILVLGRLIIAMVLGAVVAFVYTRSRGRNETLSSFLITLVLLSILIAMVTQVIGDNIARAFSLVGALSIVRFRTVVRDTQDTAFVIFAVAVGMAVGAGHYSLAVSGIGVVGLAAWIMTGRTATGTRAAASGDAAADVYELEVRVGLGHDPDVLLREVLDTHLQSRELISIATTRQGLALEVTYRASLRTAGSAGELIRALNRLEGVQGAELTKVRDDDDD
jgi:uncharacterized membrane protein YhiD involved in acid resistance